MKIVINTCHGGFGLTQAVFDMINRVSDVKYEHDSQVPHDHVELIRLMETLGSEICSGEYAELKIVEIPDDVKWQIESYDGNEWIAEQHRTWS